MTSKLIAVTGAAGHVGGVLVRELLKAGNRVRVLVRSDERALVGLDVDKHTGDVREPETLLELTAGVDAVFHLAALISLDPKRAGEMQEINVGGPRNMVAACLANGVKRLVHFSSIHALKSQPYEVPIDETRPPAERDALPYDQSKAGGEREIQAGVKQGLDAVICNPTAVMGPYDFRPSHMGEVLLELYHRRLPGTVQGAFDWVDVRDVVKSALTALERGRTGERYLLSGQHRTVPELAEIWAGITGKRAPRIKTPMWLAFAAAPFATLYANMAKKRPLFTRASLIALSNHRAVSHDKAARELGHAPRPLDETLRDAHAWFSEHGTYEATLHQKAEHA